MKMEFFTILLLGTSISATAQQTGSWGDQGDGTYRNPILNADYPDVDVEQVGDTYFMISSKQHMSPGMAILESKDMVNWKSVGHVWDKLDWGAEYNWDRMSGYSYGVWAGDLAHHDGIWYCYQIDPRHGLIMSSASDIRGPWTNPIIMLPPSKVFDDPAVIWDDEAHQAYLICNVGKRRVPGQSTENFENRIFKMSWDGTRLLDEGAAIYTGPGAEAAKVYKVNDTWYIFISEWFPKTAEMERDRKQLVLRSKTKSIYGPYERKVVLERGNGIERSCSQGALLQAADGSWWYMHQLVQNIPAPFQGRPQCLQPVTWVDGWPIIGNDEDNDGIGEPVTHYKKPINGFPITAPATDDGFTSPKLSPQWEWNHNARDTHWSLTEREGWLRLKAGTPISTVDYAAKKGKDRAIFWRASNTLSQRIMGTTIGTAIAKLDLSGMAAGQQAGFARFSVVFHLLGVEANVPGKHHLFFMGNDGKKVAGPEIAAETLYIKTSNQGDKAFYEYSTDGTSFQRFGPEFTIAFGQWSGDRLGFFCWNEQAEKGYIDIDWFHYDYDGPKKN